METNNIACYVCGGKGGFKNKEASILDDNWIDCPLCEGFGFIEKKEEEQQQSTDFIEFMRYRTLIYDSIQEIADITVFKSDEIGKDLYLELVPKDRNKWITFIKSILKFSHFSNTVKIKSKQAFYFDSSINSHRFYWEFYITMNSLKELDGVLDIIEMIHEIK